MPPGTGTQLRLWAAGSAVTTNVLTGLPPARLGVQQDFSGTALAGRAGLLDTELIHDMPACIPDMLV